MCMFVEKAIPSQYLPPTRIVDKGLANLTTLTKNAENYGLLVCT